MSANVLANQYHWQAVFMFTNGCKIGRNVGVADGGADGDSAGGSNDGNQRMLRLLCAVVREHAGVSLLQDSAVRVVRVRAHSSVGLSPAQACYPTNICGSVQHMRITPDREHFILHEGIRPCLRVKKSSFGQNRRLHGSLGNLTINDEKSIFRGFRSTADVYSMLDHVFIASSVAQNTLHMIVVTAHLGSLVFVNTHILDHELQREHSAAAPRWRLTSEECLDDVNPVKIIQLSDFDDAWLRTLDAEMILRIKMHVTSRGLVNVFVSIRPDTPLQLHCETKLLPFCNFLVGMLHKYT